METKFIRALVILGVPGVALGVFYLLLRTFNFQFSQIDSTTTGFLAVLFLLIVSAVTVYALHLWRPVAQREKQEKADASVLELDFEGERANLRETLRSVAHDVIKIDAHTHQIGVAAEYEWLRQKYPESKMVMQSLVNMNVAKSGEKKIYFDVLKIELKNGESKELYFDISSFFGDGYSSIIDPDSFIARKIQELYS
jgi:hypothetical protein